LPTGNLTWYYGQDRVAMLGIDVFHQAKVALNT